MSGGAGAGGHWWPVVTTCPHDRLHRRGPVLARGGDGCAGDPPRRRGGWPGPDSPAARARDGAARFALTKGAAVAVIGYRHRRAIPGPSGARAVEEVDAALIPQHGRADGVPRRARDRSTAAQARSDRQGAT